MGCDCGLTGVNCSDFISAGLTSDDVLDGSCFVAGSNSDACRVDPAGALFCSCKCGWTGDLCETRIVPLLYNFPVALVVLFAFIAGIFIWLGRREGWAKGCCSAATSDEKDIENKRAVKSAQFPDGVSRLSFVTSNLSCVSPVMLMGFRCIIALMAIGLEISFPIQGLGLFATFTIWNWTLLTVVYIVGAIISMKYVFWGRHSGKDYANLAPSRLEKAYHILFEIELPSTLLISAVVWGVLNPQDTDDNNVNFLTASSLFTHGVNVLFMLSELVLNKLYLRARHWVYFVSWGALYGIFHTFLMLGFYERGDDHCPVYPFLDMSTNIFMVWIVGFCLLYVIFFFIAYFFSFIKSKICPRQGNEEEIHDAKNEEDIVAAASPKVEGEASAMLEKNVSL